MSGSQKSGSHRSRWLLLLLSTGAVLATLLASGALVQAEGPTRFALSAAGDGVSCDDAGEPESCIVPLGGTFSLGVNFLGPPSQGYVAIQTQLSFGGLTYLPAASADENAWPDNALPVRAPEPPPAGTQLVSHGGLTALTTPFPVSDFEGTVVQVNLQCSATADTFEVTLIGLGDQSPLGTAYSLPDMTPVAAKSSGEAQIDVDDDGQPNTVPIADVLEISCEEVPPTPTPEPGDGTPSDGAAPTVTSVAPEGLPPTGAGNGDAVNGGGVGTALWIIIGAIAAAAAAVLGLLGWRFTQIRRAG